MGAGVRLGRVLGFEIRLDYSWFLIFFVVWWHLAREVFPKSFHLDPATSWALGLVAAVLLFVSVVVHELSHALVARRFGVEVIGITLFLFGGVAQIKGEPPSPKAEFLIAGIGPVVSLVIGGASVCAGVLLRFTGADWGAPALFAYLGLINLSLALFNLVPGFPLDGGRLLRSAIWHFTGDLRKATRWAAGGGHLFAWMLMGWGFYQLTQEHFEGLWLVVIGWFIHSAALSAYQQVLLRRALSGIAVADVMSRDIPVVDSDIRIPEFVDEYLLKHDYAVYPVSRAGEFIGVAGVEDVRRVEREHWGVTSIGAITRSPDQERVVEDTRDAWDALTQMLENDHSRLLVMHEGRLRGIVSRDAIIQLVRRKMRLGLAA